MIKKLSFPIKIQHLWVITVVVGIFIFINTHPIRPHDFWWHIAIGKNILETKTIPSVDTYSYTMYGEPYPSYQMFWLMEVFLYLIYEIGGPALTVFMQSLIITSAYIIIIYICYIATSSWRVAAFGGIFAAALGLNDWNVRPQSITFLLGAIFLLAIYTYRQKSNWRYLISLPLSMMLWVNSHGTFLIGISLITIWLFDEIFNAIKSKNIENNLYQSFIIPAITLVLTCLAMLVNPRGIGIFTYLGTMQSNQIIQNLVVEWAPPEINSFMGGLFFASLLFVAILWAVSPTRPDLFQILSFVIFAILGISTSRGIVWFGLVVAPVCAFHIKSLKSELPAFHENDRDQEHMIINNMIAGSLLLLALITLPWFKDKLPLPAEKAGLISRETPIQAVEFLLQEEPPARVFNAMSFGSYLIWTTQPNYKVFVDSRIELFPAAIWQDYLIISSAQADWQRKILDHGINTLLLNPNEQSQLIEKARSSGEWKLIYHDETAYLFTRE